jgi:rifampicin phosphotransferase
MNESNYIRTFNEIGSGDVGIVGGKGANLGEMTRAGLPVPPGFCVTAEAYRAFIAATHSGDSIRAILAQTRLDEPEHVESQTQRIRDLLCAQPMPPEIQTQVLDSYHRLSQELGEADLRVAVRSSATAEDLPTASFAGQQDTYLNIQRQAALLEHVKRCWASLWTARAVTYRVKQGFDHSQVALAVVVQAMINSEVAGILFTANPVTSNRDEAVVNASWGLGEAIVSGLVSPDTFIVRKRDGAILSRTIANKDLKIEYAAAGGTLERKVQASRRDVPALDDAQIGQLVSLCDRVEKHYGNPMDIEWGFARGQFYILQARAITTLSAAAAPETEAIRESPSQGEYNRTMFIEIFPDPLSPVFLSVIDPLFRSMLDFTFTTLGFKPARDLPATGIFYNQPYFHREYIAAAFNPLTTPVRERLVAQFVNPFGRHERGMRGELSLPFLGMTFRLLRFMTRFPKQLPSVVSEYRAKIKQVEELPLDRLSDVEIVERIRTLVLGDASRLLNYDFLMIALIGITYQMLGTLLERYFGDESEQVRAKLISGVTGNVTMETNQRIWDLADRAKQSRTVSDLVRTQRAEELRDKLGLSEEGRAFLAALEGFLVVYGHREIRMDILYPTWGEDASPVLGFIRSYLEVGESQSPYRQQERLVKQRQELAEAVQTRVRRDLIGRLFIAPIFRWVLRNTQAHTRERDTMHFELTRLFPPFRRLLLELGQRYASRGLIPQRDDIFFLTLDEMAEIASKPRSMGELVEKRRTEFQASKKRMAPGIIRDGEAVELEGVAAGAAVDGQHRGIAGSPGRVTGIARVIRGPEDFDRLKSGEILIAPLTNPVWTPLFAIAGGLVTEVGGILSHGAIVAREYGIPAVMSVRDATRVFVEGQRVTVDGNSGTVMVDS